jgi:hypothetical protein
MVRPPARIEMVMVSVMVVLGKEATWSNMKKELANPNFLD